MVRQERREHAVAEEVQLARLGAQLRVRRERRRRAGRRSRRSRSCRARATARRAGGPPRAPRSARRGRGRGCSPRSPSGPTSRRGPWPPARCVQLGRAHPPVAVPLGPPAVEADAVDHAVAEEPVRRRSARPGSARCAGSGPTGRRDRPGHRQVERGQLVGHRPVVAGRNHGVCTSVIVLRRPISTRSTELATEVRPARSTSIARRPVDAPTRRRSRRARTTPASASSARDGSAVDERDVGPVRHAGPGRLSTSRQRRVQRGEPAGRDRRRRGTRRSSTVPTGRLR